MISTVEKVRRLEQYIAADSSVVDPVINMAIDKLPEREITRMLELKTRLAGQLQNLEKKYGLDSSDFYSRYENGEMGDDMDFVEWAATCTNLLRIKDLRKVSTYPLVCLRFSQTLLHQDLSTFLRKKLLNLGLT
jgi:hypothetical protein